MTRLLYALAGAACMAAAGVLWAEWALIVQHFKENGKVTEVVKW